MIINTFSKHLLTLSLRKILWILFFLAKLFAFCKTYAWIEKHENLGLLRHRRSGVQELLAEFDGIQTKLRLLNAGISEDNVCARFLQVLSPEFDNVYITLHKHPAADKILTKLTKRCLNFELRINHKKANLFL